MNDQKEVTTHTTITAGFKFGVGLFLSQLAIGAAVAIVVGLGFLVVVLLNA